MKANSFDINIVPLYDEYCKPSTCEYTLCALKFIVSTDTETFVKTKESCDLYISHLINALEKCIEGNNDEPHVRFNIPYIAGDVEYPYYFDMQSNSDYPMTFRFMTDYYNEANEHDCMFSCDLTQEQIINLKKQLTEKYAAFDWENCGKQHFYLIDLPEDTDIPYQWVYSAEYLMLDLQQKFIGSKIEDIFVSSENYAQPLTFRENYVNYYLGGQCLIELNDAFLDLIVRAEGLFEYRIIPKDEVQKKPVYGYYNADENEYFSVEKHLDNPYKQKIDSIDIETTEFYAFDVNGFDTTQLSNPPDLPEALIFKLEDVYLKIAGGFDDFFIECARK